MNEFALIERLRGGAGGSRQDDSVVLGIGDDAALISVAAGSALAVCTDTLVAGRHFPADFTATDIGFRALAVNLSDLAAMGARPRWYQLALTLPEADAVWLDGFAAGLALLADRYSLVLTGGDLTAGPLSVTVTLMGEVMADRSLTRAGAKPGDRIFVSGALGGPARALAARAGARVPEPACETRFRRPLPRVELGLALAGVDVRLASAAIDISDGLLQDLTHICRASDVGMRLDLRRLPLPSVQNTDLDAAQMAALTGGDDYELAFTVPAAHVSSVLALADACCTGLSEIGEVIERRSPEIVVVDDNGTPLQIQGSGFQHFI